MGNLFEIEDKRGRKIRLSIMQWKHISKEHPDITSIEKIKDTLIYPTTVRPSDYDPECVRWFYRYIKEEKLYLLVSVKYLNGEGFVITAHYTNKVK
ncbi:hypothetical protein HY491_04230 [Candidatus Woesearchaeota archaeon]|nr:hypothetical protein [Candidatus Woesearchaeota archaeon]